MLAVWNATPAHTFRVHGRDRELAALTGLLDDASRGTGAACVVVGRSGVGKTALLDEVAHRAETFRVLRTRGTVAESEVPFAGLHQLLRPLDHLLSRLAPGQADPLHRAFGLSADVDPIAVRAATHALLSSAAAEGPTLCCVDSAHELDTESLAALAFAARRLDHLGVVVVFGTDHAIPAERAEFLAELPRLRLGPLQPDAGHRVLRDHLGPALPHDLADSLLDLADGNVLALVELASAVTVDQLSGRTDPPTELPTDSRLCATVRRRLSALPPAGRRVVVLAAVDHRLDRRTLDRVWATTGAGADALTDAVGSGLVEVSGTVVRPAEAVPGCTLLAATDPGERHRAHRLLADVADPVADRYRVVWHRAATAGTPSDELVRELDEVAERARAGAEHVEAAAASERAAALSADDTHRARRLVSAAGDHWAAGRPQRARTVLRQVAPLADGGLAGEAGMLAGEI